MCNRPLNNHCIGIVLRLSSTLRGFVIEYGHLLDAFTSFNSSSCTFQALARCQVVVGFIAFILAVLADFLSTNESAFRIVAILECCSFYYLLTGIIGIIGAASKRRSFLLSFMLMSVHVAVIFVPTVIIVSSFDIHFNKAECFAQCEWHLLAPTLPRDSKCQILCGGLVTENQKDKMSRLGTDFRLDAGIIAASILEMLFGVGSALLSCRILGCLCQRQRKRTEEALTGLDLDMTPLREVGDKEEGAK
uniref:Tetraspanin n=1 Tax=Syphacia muris TaxID=451379 RepID=A0A0N5AHY4_9BILA